MRYIMYCLTYFCMSKEKYPIVYTAVMCLIVKFNRKSYSYCSVIEKKIESFWCYECVYYCMWTQIFHGNYGGSSDSPGKMPLVLTCSILVTSVYKYPLTMVKLLGMYIVCLHKSVVCLKIYVPVVQLCSLF